MLLTWHTQSDGRWFAHGETHTYRISSDPENDWILRIWATDDLPKRFPAEDKMTYAEILPEAEMIAQEFENLPDDYVRSEHGGTSRLLTAVIRAYIAVEESQTDTA